MNKRMGQTLTLERPVSFIAYSSVTGPMEGEGPLGHLFDRVIADDLWGEESWEKAETKLFFEAVRLAVQKAELDIGDVDFLLGGDLLNQLIASCFAARQMDLPFIGLYGACSTMAEALCVGAMLIDGGFADKAACCASSHFSTAERQFRMPLELGCQKPPTAQRTVTGAGASIIGARGEGPYITKLTMGKVVDYGIRDANNMGAAMAPAAADTIFAHLTDSKTEPEALDAIITGDLGLFGLEVVNELLQKRGMNCERVLRDCGAEMYFSGQDTHMGGSGCGCSAVTLSGRLIPELKKGKLKKILFVAIGALLSQISSMQGESIPAIAHGVRIERSCEG